MSTRVLLLRETRGPAAEASPGSLLDTQTVAPNIGCIKSPLLTRRSGDEHAR